MPSNYFVYDYTINTTICIQNEAPGIWQYSVIYNVFAAIK